MLSNVYFIYEFKNEDIYVITSYIPKRERYYRIDVVFVKISYDPVDDLMLITLKEKPLAYGEEITPQIIAHYSKDNELVEIKVLDANELFSKREEIYVPEYVKLN